MSRLSKVLVSAALAGLVAACATAAGGMIGGGIGRATGGDEKAGALIGGGIGMMIDLMN